ncbi:MAG: hypothetical protein JWM93_1759 [Frankiales bacterium]|nr:hypothetical protein [Frankiales bacterium]
MSRTARALPLLLTGTLLAACSSTTSSGAAAGAGPSSSPATAPSTSAASASGSAASTASLKGICPDTVVIQTDWYATPERAAAYQLVGPNGTIDAKKGSYSGPLGDTGVNVEVRLGGPFIGFAPIPQQMYTDTSITLGYVATDDAVGGAAKFPTTAVVAPLDVNPQVVLWDPATYPDVKTWADVAASKAKVSYIEGMPFMDYLVSKGYVTKDQLDASFDGTPATFVAQGGKLMQQGYASNEPYRWSHDVPEWNKPVNYLLVHDAGYEIYPQGVAVRSGELTQLSPCLKAIVPMIQKAQVDYMTDPTPTNDALVAIAAKIKDGPPISADANAAAVKSMKDLKLVGNGSNSTLGDFDLARVTSTIDVLKPIFAAKKQAVPADLTAESIVTNEFIDPSITLP